MRTNHPAPRSRRGNALVEFAVGFGMLLSFLAGVVQFGYAFYAYNALESAVRNGARYASLSVYDHPNGNDFRQRVQNMVVYGMPTPPVGAKPLVHTLTTGNVLVEVRKDVKNVPNRVTVAVNDFQVNSLFAKFTLSRKPQCIFEYMGRFVTP
jgi:Flp pilus assembly protein TadG